MTLCDYHKEAVLYVTTTNNLNSSMILCEAVRKDANAIFYDFVFVERLERPKI